MRTKSRPIAGVVLAGSILLLVPMSAPAEPPGPPEQYDYATGAVTKLGRGFVNLVTGWTELVVQPWRAIQAQGPVGGPIGFGKGIGLSVLRTLAGAYEIATFPVPVPENWEPPIRPGFGLPGYEAAATPGL
jgi:putative exosortase-associated protein (TIGR04073 family)